MSALKTLRAQLNADWRRLKEVGEESYSERRMRDSFAPRFACVSLIRLAHCFYSAGYKSLAKATSAVNFLLFGCEVPAKLEIGPGLVIPHPNGIILGAGFIGSNVTIYQQVTLGAKLMDFAYDPAKRPRIEDCVTITAGAKVLGSVTLGRACTVGANAVVIADVPPESVAVGVPARIIEPSHQNSLDNRATSLRIM